MNARPMKKASRLVRNGILKLLKFKSVDLCFSFDVCCKHHVGCEALILKHGEWCGMCCVKHLMGWITLFVLKKV